MGQGELSTQVETTLSILEQSVMNEVEAQAYRVHVFEALRLLIVTGNALLYVSPDDGKMKTYRLNQYVVRRDPMGNVLEIVIKERVHPEALPEQIRDKVMASVSDPEELVDVYTSVRLEDGQWQVFQEYDDEVIPGTEGTFPLDERPWIVLRWTSIAGEDYGRGLVDEHLGDFLTLETLYQAITEGSVMASRVIFFVDPNGTTRAIRLQEAANGDVIEGRADDVTVLQLQKFADFQITYHQIERIEQRLAYAFMLMQSVQRDAERVTAEEIRTLAEELEDSLGGVYSVLSQEFQLPLVRLIMKQMQRRGKLPELPQDIVMPTIITGLEALGRGNDFNKLSLFLAATSQYMDLILPYINGGDLAQRLATSLGINARGLLKTEEQVQMEMQQAQMAAMAQQAVPGMAKEVTKGMMQGGGAGQGAGPAFEEGPVA